MSFYNKQHVFMVLAEYAFILRVIQMEKRKGDAARRTLSKSVKAVVAANQVIQGSQAPYSISQMDFLSFPFSIAKITLSTFLSLSPHFFLSFQLTRGNNTSSSHRVHRLGERSGGSTPFEQAGI